MVIVSESKSNCVRDDTDSINVRLKKDVAFSGRLLILENLRDD